LKHYPRDSKYVRQKKITEMGIKELEEYIEKNISNESRVATAIAILMSKHNHRLVKVTWVLAIITGFLAIISFFLKNLKS
jgi:hypothetical protein